VAAASTKLTSRDKMTLQAATGIEDVADFTLSTVYTARNGEEARTDEKFQRELISILQVETDSTSPKIFPGFAKGELV